MESALAMTNDRHIQIMQVKCKIVFRGPTYSDYTNDLFCFRKLSSATINEAPTQPPYVPSYRRLKA